MRWRGLEPPRPVRATRPSTLRVYQFRHQRVGEESVAPARLVFEHAIEGRERVRAALTAHGTGTTEAQGLRGRGRARPAGGAGRALPRGAAGRDQERDLRAQERAATAP